MDDEDSRKREDSNFIRSMNAMISFFLHIPFPERLDDDTWMEKVRQIQWLSEKGLLGVKTNGKG